MPWHTRPEQKRVVLLCKYGYFLKMLFCMNSFFPWKQMTDLMLLRSIRPEDAAGHFFPDDFGYLTYAALYLFASGYASSRRVLDAGCGLGFGSFLLAQSAASVAGVDINPVAIGYAKARYLHPNLSFSEANACALPFAAQSFDLVASFEVLEHLPPERTSDYLGELQRVLAPGGTLILSTPNQLVYDRISMTPGHTNEMDVPQLFSRLRAYFPEVEPWCQRKGELERLGGYYGAIRSDRFGLRRLIPAGLRNALRRRLAPSHHGSWEDLLETLRVHRGANLEELQDAVIQVAVCRKSI
jgi:SAM-dependent methyltransferase